MFIVNEQISMAINETPNVIKSALKDTEFFIKSSNHQLQAEVFESFDRTRERIKIDLEGENLRRASHIALTNFSFHADIDKLLGERITREIAVQTGLESTFESTIELLGSKF